jgi:hypothetical protein
MKEDNMDDPRPGDFDAELETLDPEFIQRLDPYPDARLTVQLTISAEDADALRRIADERGENLSDALGSLIRDASDRAAKPAQR